MRSVSTMCFLCAVVLALVIEECIAADYCFSCGAAQLVDHEQNISMTCYSRCPRFDLEMCRFSITKRQTIVHVKNVSDTNSVSINRHNCSLKMSLQEFNETAVYKIYAEGRAGGKEYINEKHLFLMQPRANIEACGRQSDGNNTCVCTSSPYYKPKGTANWYQGNKKLDTTHTENGTRSTLILTSVTEDPRQNDYKCVVNNVFGNGSKHLNLEMATGSYEITVSLVDEQRNEVRNEPLSLCGNEGLDLTVICTVKQTNVLSRLTSYDVRLHYPNGITTLNTSLDSSGGDYQCINKVKINSAGSHKLLCEAKNPIFPDIKKIRSVTIEARKPPNTKPVISAYSRQNGDVLVHGDDVTVMCSTYGGYPSVQSVTLTCGHNQSVTSNGTSTQLILNKIGPSNSVIYCICEATHVTGCYNLMGVIHLTIISVNPDKADENLFTMAQFVGGNIGSIVGLSVIGAVIALIVFCVRKEMGKRKSRSEDTEENVPPRDNNYLTMKSAVQAPSSASPIVKTQLYSNQAYVDPADPTATYESIDQIAQIPGV